MDVRRIPHFILCATVSGLAALSAGAADTTSIDREARALFARHTAQVMRLRPLAATRIGYSDEDLGIRVNDAMDDYSAENMQQWRRNARQMRTELEKLPDTSVDPLTRAALDEIYQAYLGAPLPFGYIDALGRHRPYIVNQIDQPLQEVPKYITIYQQVRSEEDVADYLRRLWALTSLVNGVLAKFNRDADGGWLPPRPVLEGAIASLQAFVAPPVDEHPLVVALLEKADASGALSEEARAKVSNEANAVMIRLVYPAYRNAIETIRARLPETKAAAGIWARPNGQQFYAASLRIEAWTDRSPGEIHALGKAEVDRILAEMDTVLAKQGYRDGSVGERMQRLAGEERFLFPDTEAGRSDLLARIESTAADMLSRLPDYFGELPEREFVVRPVPEARQAGEAAGSYSRPPADGDQPGIFWINLRAMDELPWFNMPTLTYHETVPGHHLQLVVSASQASRPDLWRFGINSAYSEGWALYAERLAAEMGVYADDPFGDLGRLQAELFRAVRLVVDTGIHDQRWTMEQAIAYMEDTTGRGSTQVRAEVLRYMAWPGQALSYKLGMVEILAMREEARALLGEQFDLAAFHNQVLGAGQVSMPLLRRQVLDWARR